VNGGFETPGLGENAPPPPWTPQVYEGSNVSRDYGFFGRGGTAGVRLYNGWSAAACWIQSVPVEAGRTYRLSGFLATYQLTTHPDSHGGCLRVIETGSVAGDLLNSANKWQEVSLEFVAPAASVTVGCCLGLPGHTVAGVLTCDELALTVVK
jgi:hypothetical protein